MTLINMTPHPVAIYRNNTLEEGPVEVIPPSGTVVRLATIELGTQMQYGASYELVEYGHAHDLPPKQPDTYLIVSLVVALAVHRGDLLAPFIEVRNADGTMVGCRYLQMVV
jgi:hypothetical protein